MQKNQQTNTKNHKFFPYNYNYANKNFSESNRIGKCSGKGRLTDYDSGPLTHQSKFGRNNNNNYNNFINQNKFDALNRRNRQNNHYYQDNDDIFFFRQARCAGREVFFQRPSVDAPVWQPR
ncbi:Hypothetical protein, putative [Bodo saltans]|uniref:Uncharacterized protein n=1 Tax=Bodo saltans TaxID=75058 RepID=A0A0S4JD82_BODSA|nr:Hypothetical protein, putative [Bodo saltans]|eukprot:CUG89352.1 Hypothetical protein, putative [Bodo saltans]